MNILFGAIGALALLVGTGRAADDKAPARNVRITVFHSSQRLEKISGAGATKTRTTSETRQEILVMSGGRARIQVLPRDGRNDNPSLRHFAGAIQKIAPDATGPPISTAASLFNTLAAWIAPCSKA